MPVKLNRSPLNTFQALQAIIARQMNASGSAIFLRIAKPSSKTMGRVSHVELGSTANTMGRIHAGSSEWGEDLGTDWPPDERPRNLRMESTTERSSLTVDSE